MSRNPYGALRHRHEVIPDKRDKTLRQLWNDTAKEEIPEEIKRLLDELK